MVYSLNNNIVQGKEVVFTDHKNIRNANVPTINSFITLKQPLSADMISFSSFKDVNKVENKASTKISNIQLNQFLNHIEKKSLKYFIDHRLPNGLVLDRAPNSKNQPSGLAAEMASIATTGYGLTAWVLAAEKNIIPKDQAKQWVMESLKFVDAHTPKIQGGWLAHFVDSKTGEIYKDTEVSSVDTALFFFNAFIAAEYFGGEVKDQVNKMFDNIDFDLMLTQDNKLPDSKAFSLGFHLKDGKREFIQYKWDEYSEGILVPLLALGSDKVKDSVWSEGWDRSKQWKYDGKESFVSLPLFTYYYPHGLLDLKDKVDVKGDNYWQSSLNAVQMQIKFCQDKGYPSGIFGITACDGPNGYQPYQPAGTEEYPAHDGTVGPPAIIACLPFAEKEVTNLLDFIKKNQLDNEEYGLCNAYNVKSGWKTEDALGIDLGSMLLMTDQYQSGFIHKLSNRSPMVNKIMQRAGFKAV